MRNLRSLLFAITCLSSCVSTKYTPFDRPYTYSPRGGAISREGTAAQYIELVNSAQAPHLSDPERQDMWNDAQSSIVDQMGSPDYFMMGHIYSTGEDVSLADLKGRMIKRASKEGGDVVLFFNSDQRSQPWSYTTPGYATTNTYGQANAYATPNGNGYNVNGYGSATSSTTYTPPQTYYGSTLYTMAEGFVLRYERGFAEYAARVAAAMNETEAGRADLVQLANESRASKPLREDYRARVESILQRHEKVNAQLRVPD